VTAAVVSDGSGRILAARRAPGQRLAGKWEFPGGKIEPDEEPRACLEREIREELGVEIRAGELVAESRYDYEHARIALEAYHAELVSGDFTLSVHDRIAWIERESLGDFDFAPADLPVVEALAERDGAPGRRRVTRNRRGGPA